MLNRIRQQQRQLSAAEQRVATWVSAQPHTAVRAALATVATQSGTSEPTVIRFCRSLGCAGFRDFKVRLAQDLAGTRNYIHHDVEVGDGLPEIIAKIAERTIHVLTDTRDNLSARAVEQAATAMCSARQIQFLGVGASGIVARDAQHKFFRLGVPCVAHADGPTILQAAAIAGASDCFVVISNSGRSPEIIRACKAIKNTPARLIVIAAPGSPASRLADIAVDVDTHEDGNVYTPTNSRLAHLLVLDILQVSVALSLGEQARENLRRTNEVLADVKTDDTGRAFDARAVTKPG